MKTSNINPVFSQNVLDRMDHKRANILTCRLSELQSPTDRYLLISQGNVMLNKAYQSCFFSAAEVPPKLLTDSLCIFLGGYQGLHYFVLEVSQQRQEYFDRVSLRELASSGKLPDPQLGMFAEANSLLCWHNNHGFCARCGVKSVVAHGGWRRDCPSCDTEHFPRTDPVAIMLVTHGDYCLLGRGHHFESRVFSCLAGFMEPGETILQTACRELWEEAGVRAEKATYMFDQPWPFPSNLMMGVHIEAQDKALTIDQNELAEAIWVSKDDIKAALAGDESKPFLLPPRLAIARDLLEYWVR
jgi:NAD+ diphosphatase